MIDAEIIPGFAFPLASSSLGVTALGVFRLGVETVTHDPGGEEEGLEDQREGSGENADASPGDPPTDRLARQVPASPTTPDEDPSQDGGA